VKQTPSLTSHDIATWLALPSESLFVRGRRVTSLAARPEQPLNREALKTSYGHSQLLPIESLKEDAADVQAFRGLHPARRTFLSSGTTRDLQSRSPFSSQGLELYRTFALKAFWAMMERYAPDPRRMAGVSLVPSPQEWPLSSLAQMVAWIGEEVPLQYWDGSAPLPERPLWLFATAFHLVQLADQGCALRLPAGSVVIETGGTKGRSRSVTRAELYQLIESCLGVPPNRIISEYGMCELASQAYDFLEQPDGPSVPLAERRFRFPSWVHVSVIDALGQEHDEGYGSLVIDDPLRIDLPWPLRTEDQGNITNEGAFRLLGRVPHTPLKGCSLLAEDLVGPQVQANKVQAAPRLERWELDPKRLSSTRRALDRFLEDPRLKACLATQLGSQDLARIACLDIHSSLPQDGEAWARAALGSLGGGSARRWLLIPPQTHPLALLQPLVLACALDIQVTLRMVEAHEAFYRLWFEHLEDLASIKVLPPRYRLGEDRDPEVEAVLVFGSNATLLKLASVSPWPLQGFGTLLTATVVSRDSVEAQAGLIWKDALSLGQKGCLSSRLLFVIGADDTVTDRDALLHTLARQQADWAKVPSDMSLGLMHTAYAERRRGRYVLQRQQSEQALLLFDRWQPEHTLADLLCDRPWALPVIAVQARQQEDFARWLARQHDLYKISVCAQTFATMSPHLPQESCRLGEANAPIWDGTHQRRGLFDLTSPAGTPLCRFYKG
jgi:hypothetical protein